MCRPSGSRPDFHLKPPQVRYSPFPLPITIHSNDMMPLGTSPPMSMMATARAERGLLGALSASRAAVGKNPLIKSQAGLSAVVRPETDSLDGDVSSDSLLARQNHRESDNRLPVLPAPGAYAQQTLREIDEVRMLHHQPLETKLPRSGFEKLRKKQGERRERDACAVRRFEGVVAAVSEEVESKVLEASYKLRDGLEATEEAVAVIQKELEIDEHLVLGDMLYVEGMWSSLQSHCARRSACTKEFRQELEGIERLRSEAIGGGLRHLVDDMVAIACRMPDEVERIAEEHASELNSVLISNRLAHAELLVKMEKDDFAFSVGIRRAWEIRRESWRCLRHDRALGYFRADLTAPNFTNPPERVALFREFKEGQALRHARRVHLLRDLCSRRPGVENNEGKLEPAVVSAIRDSYAALHSEEIAAILSAREGQTRIMESKQVEAAARRESLRAELHKYGALSAEPDLEACCLQMEKLAHDPASEEFMRKAGALKHELLTLVQVMRGADIIYDMSLSAAVDKTELMLCGVDLERVLDRQGKTGMRRAIIDSVERLRKAAKNDILAALELLRCQIGDLAQVSDLDPLLVLGLERTVEDIDHIVATIERRGNSDIAGTAVPSVGSRVSRGSVLSRGNKGAYRGSVCGSSGGSRSMRSSGKVSRGSLSRGGGWESEIEIDMLQVRAVQRRLGMFACTSDLTEGFKEKLRGVRRALEQQRACNLAVDAAVTKEANGELDARFSEHSKLLDRSVRAMDSRALGLHTSAERICSFFANIAMELEDHETREAAIDDAAEVRMFECKEDFRLADEDREEAVKAATSRVRMAADEQELEASFARAISLLDEIEESYRGYYKTTFTASAIQTAEAAEEASRVSAAVCILFGLRPPTDTASPSPWGEHDDGGEGEVEVDNRNSEGAGSDTRDMIVDGGDAMKDERTEEVQKTVEVNARDPAERRYAPPALDERQQPMYDVDQSPEEIARTLLENFIGNCDEDGTESVDSVNDDKKTNDGQELKDGDDMQEKKKEDAFEAGDAGQKSGGKGTKFKKADTEGSNVDLVSVTKNVVIPSLWRRGFAPLGEEEMQALERDKGTEALQEYLDIRDRRFRELTEQEYEALRAECEAAAAARTQAREDVAKKAKKGAKKIPKGGTPPPPEEPEVDPPSAVEVYDNTKRVVEEHRKLRQEERAQKHEEEQLVPRDPAGEVVMEEVSIPVDEMSSMLQSLRDDLMARVETRAITRRAVTTAQCAETRELLTEELEERLRKHWPRKGRTEVRDKLAEQEKAFQQELQKASFACKEFSKALDATMSTALPEATNVATLQGVESRCKRLVARFEAEREAFIPQLERFVKDEPTRLLTSCDDVTRLCRKFANGGDYDDKELDELERVLEEPRREISEATEERRAAIVEVLEEHKRALEAERRFKEEHANYVMELSLREGLGQRYGAPRRNAQERLRSIVMRDQRCADTVQRLLDDLEDLLSTPQNVIITAVDGTTTGMPVGGTTMRTEGINDSTADGKRREFGSTDAPSVELASGQQGPAWGRAEEIIETKSGHSVVGARRRISSSSSSNSSSSSSSSGNNSLAQRLRSNLISIREAVFRHASFLEFLSAPGSVERRMIVSSAGADEKGTGNRKELDEKDADVLDPEVILMPQGGETFARALDSLEARCRSETRILYESEGKAELLGEDGVPDSLRTWLEESRGRALDEGGHREGAQRRLREQVERFEFLVGKRPVPPERSVRPRAPALMLSDVSSRLAEAACIRRSRREKKFEHALAVWRAAREKHQRLLRPVLSSADRREELQELLALEAGRAVEARSAIAAFQRGLLQEELAGARDSVEKIAATFEGVMAILDSVIMTDDLGKLPGDDDKAPKRKGLRRLRKAERTLQKQAQQYEEQRKHEQPIKGKAVKGAVTPIAGAPTVVPSATGGGRQWNRRHWKAVGLPDLVQTMLVAGQEPNKRDSGDQANGTAGGRSILGATATPGEAAARRGSSKVKDVAQDGKQKGKGSGAGKGKQVAATEGNGDDEEGDNSDARREAEVQRWAEGLREALERETYVTTAHRVAVAARDSIVLQLVDQIKNIVTEVEERYGRLYDAELQWETKWKQLVDLLISNEAV